MRFAIGTLVPLLSLPLTLALPTLQPRDSSPSFRLHSHVLDTKNPSFENLVLEPYHIYPAFNYAVLSPKSPRISGIVGHINGTADEIANAQGDLIFDYAGSGFPYGFVIDQSLPNNPVEINAGAGTKGVNVDQGFIKYRNPLSGGFYGE